jgi:hypothetical protein
MCIFGTPKTPSVSPAPAPAPAPTPVQSEGVIGDEESRRKRLQRQRMGLYSTIKTSPRGILGSGAELSSNQAQGGKKTLGA